MYCVFKFFLQNHPASNPSNSQTNQTDNYQLSQPNDIPNDNQQNYEQESIKEFIIHFSTNYFELLNNLGSSATYQLGICHFFNSCMLSLNLINFGEEKNELLNNSMSILEYLLNLKVHHELYFNPYLPGVKWEKDLHGLIKIIIGGNLYQKGECIGTFEQLFFLGEDLQEKNIWKIMSTSLNLLTTVLLLSNEMLEIEELT